jgi:hypothetical protein
VLFGDLAVFMRIDDDEARFVIRKMPLDQRQRAFADRAEADHDNRAGNFRVDLRRGRVHGIRLRKGDALAKRGDQAERRFAVTSTSIFISGL